MADNDGRVQISTEDALRLYIEKNEWWQAFTHFSYIFLTFFIILATGTILGYIFDLNESGFKVQDIGLSSLLSLAISLLFLLMRYLVTRRQRRSVKVLSNILSSMTYGPMFNLSRQMEDDIRDRLLTVTSIIIRNQKRRPGDDTATRFRNDLGAILDAAKALGILPESAEYGEFFKEAEKRIAEEQDKPAATAPTTSGD